MGVASQSQMALLQVAKTFDTVGVTGSNLCIAHSELLPAKIHNFLQAWAKVRGKLARVR